MSTGICQEHQEQESGGKAFVEKMLSTQALLVRSILLRRV